MEEHLWIFDSCGMFFRAVHAVPPLTNSRGVPTGAVYGFTRQLLGFLKDHGVTHCVAVLPAQGARNFRKDLDPAYKANRPPMAAEVASQFKLLRPLLKALPVVTYEAPGFEDDDGIAALAAWAPSVGLSPVVVSSDKDLLQTLGYAKVYDPGKRAWIDDDDVVAKFGVHWHQVGDLLALAGDAGDGIAGVDGWGLGKPGKPGGAAKLLAEHGTLDAALVKAETLGGKKGAALRAAAADGSLERYRTLVRLRTDAPVPFTSADQVRLPPPNERTRDFLFRHLEFDSLLSTGMPTPESLGMQYDASARARSWEEGWSDHAIDTNAPHLSLPVLPPPRRKFQVWMEGYLTNGMDNVPAHALYMGEFEADSFEGACCQAFPSPDQQDQLDFPPNGRPSYWACQLFDNEADARKSFG